MRYGIGKPYRLSILIPPAMTRRYSCGNIILAEFSEGNRVRFSDNLPENSAKNDICSALNTRFHSTATLTHLEYRPVNGLSHQRKTSDVIFPANPIATQEKKGVGRLRCKPYLGRPARLWRSVSQLAGIHAWCRAPREPRTATPTRYAFNIFSNIQRQRTIIRAFIYLFYYTRFDQRTEFPQYGDPTNALKCRNAATRRGMGYMCLYR